MAEKKKRPRRRKRKNSGLNELKRKIRESGLLKENKIVFRESEGPKLSATFLNFIEPYKEFATTFEAFRKLVLIGIVAWDASLLRGPERRDLIEGVINSVVTTAGEQWRKDAEDILKMLMKRKQNYFADDQRFIVDYHLAETKDEYKLALASFEKR